MNPYDPSSTTPSAGQTATTKTRRYLVAAALLGGGVTLGALFSPVGLANAQSDDSTTEPSAPSSDGSDSDADADPSTNRDGRGHGGHRGHGKGAHVDDLAEVLGLDADELRSQLGAGATLADIAGTQGVDTEDLVDVVVNGARERLDAAVAAGRIDQDRADAKLAEVEERFRDSLDDPFTGGGRGGPMGGGGLKGLKGGAAEVAESLGLDLAELRQAIEDGQTVAEAAEAQGVTADQLTEALVAAANDRIDEAVASGRIDEDQATELRERVGDRVDDLLNGSFTRGFGHGGHGGHGGFGGRGHGDRFGGTGPDAGSAPSAGSGETQESSVTA